LEGYIIFITLTILIIKINSIIQIVVLWTRPWCPSLQLRFNYILILTSKSAQSSTSHTSYKLTTHAYMLRKEDER
jgi:hypothetical protein